MTLCNVSDGDLDVLVKASVELDTVLCVGVNDILSELMNGGFRTVSGNHNEVCGVKVYANTVCAEAVKESAEDLRGLGTGLDCECGTDGIGIKSKLTACLAHDFLLLALFGGNGADVSGNNVALKLLCKIEHSL